MAGRAALVDAARIGIVDLAVGVVATAADEALACDQPEGDVGQQALELRQHIAAQVDVAWVLGRKMDRDDERLAQRRERTLVGGRKRVASVFCHVDRCPRLGGE